MRAIQSGMLHISHWARNNKNKSRALIVLLRTILMTAAILSGLILSDRGRPAGDWLLISGVLLFFTGLYYYPSVKAAVCNTNRRNRYFRQKLSGMAITSSAVLMFIYIGSQMQELPVNSKSSFPFIKQVNRAVARKSSLNKIDHSITLSPKKTKKQGFLPNGRK